MVKMQKNAKRFCAVLLALGVLLSMSTVISARYAAIRSLTAGLTISSSGYASCQGTCTVQSEYDAKVVLELQQKKGTSWTTIMDWSDSGRRVSFDKGQFVSRGYDYRLKISADIYDSDLNTKEMGLDAHTGIQARFAAANRPPVPTLGQRQSLRALQHDPRSKNRKITLICCTWEN